MSPSKKPFKANRGHWERHEELLSANAKPADEPSAFEMEMESVRRYPVYRGTPGSEAALHGRQTGFRLPK